MSSLEQQVARLVAIDAITALKARYARLADQKYTAAYQRVDADTMHQIACAQAACFTDDAVWQGGAQFGADLHGRAALAAWFERSPWCYAMHYYVSPEIDIGDGADHARARWRLWQLALRADTGQAVLLAGVTDEEYRRQPDGTWRCARMQFEQIQMLPVSDQAFPLMTTFRSTDTPASCAAATTLDVTTQ